jgi:hypothetical protein
MNLLLRAMALVLVLMIASPVLAQTRTSLTPEPLPMGMPYIYERGNPYWYQPLTYYPTAYYTYSSPYPFGSTSPVFGLYSWDYGVYYPTTVNWYPTTVASYPTVSASYPAYSWYPTTIWTSPYVYQYPLPGRIWLGFGW